MQYGVYKLTSVSLLPKSKKGAQDTADRLQAPTRGADQSTLANNVRAMVPLSSWLKRDEAKMK
jgi:hypothetical protein